jgi:hypothetical protein
MVTYDFNGNIQKEEQIEKITDDLHFFIYGSYMVVWLGQLFDNAISRRDNDDFKKIYTILDVIFGENKKSYTLSEALLLFNRETKEATIQKHASVQFKINKTTRGTFVRVINIPLLQEFECQLYLFVILSDFFCKQYINAKELLDFSYHVLERRIGKEVSESNPCQAIAHEVTKGMIMNFLKKQCDDTSL